MSQRAVKRLQEELGERVLETSDFRGDDEVRVAPESWLEAARCLHDDADLRMNHFIDLTAVDYPERELDEDVPRFDVLLMVRSMPSGDRIRLKTRVSEEHALDSLAEVWGGANWAEREVYDMFGIRFKGHPDLRRILMYPEFEGHPLRKDYPIDRTQPLVPYRRSEGVNKLEPFGRTEGQPWNRIDWFARMGQRNVQVSPAIAVQQGEREGISISNERQAGMPENPEAEEGSAEREGEA